MRCPPRPPQSNPLQRRHTERDGVSNHQRHECLRNRLAKAQIKENIKAPRHWPLWGNSMVTGEFPAQRTSNADNVFIWWRHHANFRVCQHCGLVFLSAVHVGYAGSSWLCIYLDSNMSEMSINITITTESHTKPKACFMIFDCANIYERIKSHRLQGRSGALSQCAANHQGQVITLIIGLNKDCFFRQTIYWMVRSICHLYGRICHPCDYSITMLNSLSCNCWVFWIIFCYYIFSHVPN